jgi:hypothetical protein
MAEEYQAAVGVGFNDAGNLSIREKMRPSMSEVNLNNGPSGQTDTDYVECLGLPLTNSHNVRSAKLSFHIPHAGVMHGLAGYFEATLYGHIGLSIHPHSKDRVSKDMLSWFPLFFPFKVGVIIDIIWWLWLTSVRSGTLVPT